MATATLKKPLLFSLFEYLHEAFPSLELIGDNDDPRELCLTIGPNPDVKALMYPSLIHKCGRDFLQGAGFQKESSPDQHSMLMSDGKTRIVFRCFLQQPNGILHVTITPAKNA